RTASPLPPQERKATPATARASAAGVRIRRGGRETIVAFRKEGASGPALLEGTRFDGRVLVR
ncbi:MAG: hypothetical protein N2689_02120, partial [Verrucomicrobiae bacterium]|nr:hypothetical protein [Verrucomicrobiae bacterium]